MLRQVYAMFRIYISLDIYIKNMFCHIPLPAQPICHTTPKSIHYAIVRLPVQMLKPFAVKYSFWFENDIFRVKISKFFCTTSLNLIDFLSDFQPLTDTSKNSGKKSKDASGGGKKKRKNSKKEILIVVSSPNSSDSGEKDSDDVSSHSSRLEIK